MFAKTSSFEQPIPESGRRASPSSARVRSRYPRQALACLSLLTSQLLHAALPIPAERLTDWIPGVTVGVPGGIPNTRTNRIDVTLPPYNADNSGATDARGAIQSAINAAQPDDVVYLPSGRYRIDGALGVGFQKKNITVRGAGQSTVIDCRSPNYGINVGTAFSYSEPKTGNVLTPSRLTKGTTILEIQSTSDFNVGALVMVGLGNDPAIPVVSVFGYDSRPAEGQWQPMRRQISRVTAKTATTLTIFPGLYGDYSGSPNAKVLTVPFHTVGIGIEDLVIDCTNGSTTFGVGFNTAYGCWTKNVTVKNSSNYGFYISESLQCEIRHCWVDRPKGQGSTSHCGILVDTGVGCLIEDNVVAHNFPSMMVNHGSCGNVIAYNFFYDSSAYGVQGASINTNHGPHNSYNLYEGNIAPNVQSDGYFGSASHDTIFRNWLHGMVPAVSAPNWTVSLNRFTRYYSFVGNIFGNPTWPTDGVSLSGNPNMGNGMSSGNGPPWSNATITGPGTISQNGTTATTTQPVFNSSHVYQFIHIPKTWTLARIESVVDSRTVILNNSLQVSGAMYLISPGPSGYQELDGDVLRTTVRKGNYNYRDFAVPAAESVSPSDIPNSLYLSGKPAWFGSMAWPGINSYASPMNPVYEMIPAGYRFKNPGQEAPGVDSGINIADAAPSRVRIRRVSQ